MESGATTHDLRFVRNDGQWDTPAGFVAHSGKLTVRLEPDAILLQLDERPGHPGQGVLVRLAFDGSSPATLIEGTQPLAGVHHYFLGNDPARWRRDVPGFAAVRYAGLYPGVAVQVTGRDGIPKYDVELGPGAQADWVVMRCDGAEGLRLDADGALLIDTALGPIRQAPPPSWQLLSSGERVPVTCRYRLIGDFLFGFEVETTSTGHALVIDPELEWSTYLGSSDYDGINGGMVMTADGRPALLGDTPSLSFPVTPGAYDTSFNGGNTVGCMCDAYVTCFDSTGSSLAYSTFLGGDGNEQPYDVSLGPGEDIYLTGWTGSDNFPVTPGAFDTTKSTTGTDAFVSRLSANGSQLVYSTYLGGSIIEEPRTILSDQLGEAVIFGTTSSQDFPTTPFAYDRTHGGSNDAFVTRISADGGSLVFSTFLGGTDNEGAYTGLVELDGSVLVGGRGWMDIPTTPGTFQPIPPEEGGAFILRLRRDGSVVETGTFLAGTKSEVPLAMALGPAGEIVVAGFTTSADFPTTPGAFQPSISTFFGPVGFVSSLESDLSQLNYSTYVNGFRAVYFGGIHVDSAGTVTLSGSTNSPDFPTTIGAYMPVKQGAGNEYDTFVLRLSADGSRLYYSTFFGGTLHDAGAAMGSQTKTRLGVGPLGTVTISGHTQSTDLPVTSGAYQTQLAGEQDAFVTRFDPLPAGAVKYGDSTPGCRGPIPIGVTAMPKYGTLDFALTSTNAEPLAHGFLVLGVGSLTSPVAAVGADLWIDPTLLFAAFPVGCNDKGFALVPLRIEGPPSLIGVTAYSQFFWKDSCGTSGWASSNALSITIQP